MDQPKYITNSMKCFGEVKIMDIKLRGRSRENDNDLSFGDNYGNYISVLPTR
jgi:hypothetical protein